METHPETREVWECPDGYQFKSERNPYISYPEGGGPYIRTCEYQLKD